MEDIGQAKRRQGNNTVQLDNNMWEHIEVKEGESFLVRKDKNKYGKFISIFVPNEDNIESKAILRSFDEKTKNWHNTNNK